MLLCSSAAAAAVAGFANVKCFYTVTVLVRSWQSPHTRVSNAYANASATLKRLVRFSYQKSSSHVSLVVVPQTCSKRRATTALAHRTHNSEAQRVDC